MGKEGGQRETEERNGRERKGGRERRNKKLKEDCGRNGERRKMREGKIEGVEEIKERNERGKKEGERERIIR